MTGTRSTTALCSALAIELDGDGVPEWLQLLPAREARGADGRGPYFIPDATALMAASLPQGEKLVLDECHATDLAAPQGKSAPARGWIVELQARESGIWGRVEWTGQGRQIITDKQYRGVSPVIAHRKDGTVTRILRASLTNTPNFAGLASLHQEEHGMDWKAKLIELLKLDSGADDDAIVAALTKKMEAAPENTETALQSALAPIAQAAGLAADAKPEAIVAGVQKLAGGESATITSLQSEVAGLTTALQSVSDAAKRKDAEAFVDGAIREGRVGVKPARDDYVSMHMENPSRAEKLIGAMPILKPGTALDDREVETDEIDDPVQLAAHAASYQKKLADDGQTIDFATAVRAVQEGKHK